jgi:hypothetical protein
MDTAHMLLKCKVTGLYSLDVWPTPHFPPKEPYGYTLVTWARESETLLAKAENEFGLTLTHVAEVGREIEGEWLAEWVGASRRLQTAKDAAEAYIKANGEGLEAHVLTYVMN